jgi:hypothetical protein
MQKTGLYEEQPSGWAVGWATFAAVMMIMMGIWWIFAGVVAIINDDFYVVAQEWIFKIDVTTWGWVHIGLGIVTMLAGFSIFSGAVWARIVGVVLAIGTGLVAFAWLPSYPIWAVILIAVSVLVVWALTVHGRDISKIYQ